MHGLLPLSALIMRPRARLPASARRGACAAAPPPPPPPLPPLPPLARAPALLSPVSLRAGDGTIKPVDLRNKDAAAVAAVVAAMRDTATGRVRKFRQPVVSRTPSVQGVWDPSNTYEEFELRSCKEGVGKGL